MLASRGPLVWSPDVMTNIAYFEDPAIAGLYPLTWLRAGFELRCGCDRLCDKVRQHLAGDLVRLYLRRLVQPTVAERTPLETADANADWCLLNARTMITRDAAPPKPGTRWMQDGEVIAVGLTSEQMQDFRAELLEDAAALHEWLDGFRVVERPDGVDLVRHPWELPLRNAGELVRQCQTGDVQGGRVYGGAHLITPEQVFLGPGSVVKPGAVIDADSGPVHLAEDALIEPNAVDPGPLLHRARSRSSGPARRFARARPSARFARSAARSRPASSRATATSSTTAFLGHSYRRRVGQPRGRHGHQRPEEHLRHDPRLHQRQGVETGAALHRLDHRRPQPRPASARSSPPAASSASRPIIFTHRGAAEVRARLSPGSRTKA
jgi:hypothetical protein